MKLLGLRSLVWLLLALVFLSAGCATKRPMVNTWRNPQFSPARTNTVALTQRPNPTPEDAALGQMVVAELQHAGFTLGPAERADYLLTYVFSENAQERVVNGPALIRMQPPQTTGQIGSDFYQRGNDFYLSSVPANQVWTSQYRAKDIRLYLYTNPKTHPAGFQQVWQGTIMVGNKVSSEREQVLLRTLFRYFGQDQNGRVELAP